LVYLRNRWYSPDLGQFVAQDPAGFVDSYNLYAYVGFDPINASDPTGLNSQGPAQPRQPQPSVDTRRSSLTKGKFKVGLGISDSISATASTRDDALTGRQEKRSVDSKGNIDLGLSWTALSGSEGKERKWLSYNPDSHRGSWGRESEDTTKYSIFSFGLSTSGLKVTLGDFSHTTSSSEVGGVVGDWYAGLTWDITSTGPSLKGSVGLENAEAKVVAGVSLLSYSGSVGLNVLGANVSLTGGVNLGGKFGFEIGAKTTVHAVVFSVGIDVGAAKSSNPEAGWGPLAGKVLDYWVKPVLPQTPGGWQFPHPFQ
jgi:hypothetical protein